MGNNPLARLRARLLGPVALAATLGAMLVSPASAAAPAPLSGGSVVKMPGVPTTTGPAWSGDISWVDQNGTYYLADRTLKGIDVVDTSSKYVTTITGGFVGVKLNKKGAVDNDHSGPNGLVVIDGRHEAWAGDGDSTVKVADLTSNSVVASISTGGSARADELAYDPNDQVILIANDADDPPFVTFISVTNRTVLGQIKYPDATNGIEQPQFDSVNGKFYIAIPQTKQNPGGQIDVIDPVAMAVVNTYPTQNCVPHGLTFGPNSQMLLGCSGDAIKLLGAPAQSQIMDANNGNIVAVVNGIGGSDEVWYNSGDNRYYLAASSMTSDGTKAGKPAPVLGVIDAGTYQYLGGIPTAAGAHSVAADAKSGRVFIPVPTKGLTVYTLPVLKHGATVSGVLNGRASGTFNAYNFIGDGGPLAVAFTYDRTFGVDPGMNLQIGGPGGSVANQTGVLPGIVTSANQGSISLTSNAAAPTGTVNAYVNTVDGATYEIIVGNYNPGFTSHYSLSIQ